MIVVLSHGLQKEMQCRNVTEKLANNSKRVVLVYKKITLTNYDYVHEVKNITFCSTNSVKL